MEDAEPPRHPTGSVRHVTKRVDMSRFGTRKRLWWFPDFRDAQMHARLQREIAALNEFDRLHPEIMADIEAMTAEVMADEPDYDWGPNGPPC